KTARALRGDPRLGADPARPGAVLRGRVRAPRGQAAPGGGRRRAHHAGAHQDRDHTRARPHPVESGPASRPLSARDRARALEAVPGGGPARRRRGEAATGPPPREANEYRVCAILWAVMGRGTKHRLTLWLALVLALSGCATVRQALGVPSLGDPSVTIKPAETRWLLIKNPRF